MGGPGMSVDLASPGKKTRWGLREEGKGLLEMLHAWLHLGTPVGGVAMEDTAWSHDVGSRRPGIVPSMLLLPR